MPSSEAFTIPQKIVLYCHELSAKYGELWRKFRGQNWVYNLWFSAGLERTSQQPLSSHSIQSIHSSDLSNSSSISTESVHHLQHSKQHINSGIAVLRHPVLHLFNLYTQDIASKPTLFTQHYSLLQPTSENAVSRQVLSLRSCSNKICFCVRTPSEC